MKLRPIHSWLEATGMSRAQGAAAADIPTSTFYRLMDEEDQHGSVQSIGRETIEKLVNNSDGHIRPDDLLDIKPAKKRKRKAA